MAIATTLEQSLKEEISEAKLLVVGAGGIGCELLKNLVLTGFTDIDVIDLDTIDVSNLNRQFLFQKRHVGKSKAVVARESVLRLNPNAKITAYHESIFEKHFDCDFYKRFTLVLNALDNRTARNHVNRMCLNADVPLVESGSAGYLGQVTVIKRGLTECYECQPKPTQKTYPGCTIRNTPSEPIHCIVWAKHLFNQLFGEDDPDQDVSPDTADPEATADAGQHALRTEVDENDDNSVGGIKRVSTREWARNCDWNPKKLFDKFFHDDIKYLLSMDRLWQTRRPPTPLDWNDLPDAVPGSSTSSTHGLISDQVMWSMQQFGEVFQSSVNILKENLKEKSSQDDQHSYLIWDKDDDPSLDFVTAASNFRCHIFGIQQKTRFDIKSMAGNIIPAIATTNAVIAGLIVMEALKILQKDFDKCRTTYLNKTPNPRKKLLNPCLLDKPNPKCPVCSEKHEVTVQLNCKSTTVKCFEEKVLKGALSMTAPDVEIEDGKGTVLISSDPSDCTDENNEKHLDFFGIGHNTRLRCDDFFQNFEIIVNIYHSEELTREVDFEIIGDVAELKAKLEKEPNENEAIPNQVDGKVENEVVEKAERTNGQRNGTADAKSNGPHQPKDVDMVSLLSDEEDDASKGNKLIRKRKVSNGDDHATAVIKKARVEHAAPPTDDEDLIVL